MRCERGHALGSSESPNGHWSRSLCLSGNRPEKLKKYDRCGTVQDLVVSLLCASDDVKMSSQNAASWGYFLTESNQWDTEALSSDGFPFHLLPTEILAPGQPAGKLAHNWFGVPAGVTRGHLLCSSLGLRDSLHPR